MFDQITFSIQADVATITLNRPSVGNAISLHMASEIATAVTQATATERCRLLVLTGAGDRIFSAGADLNEVPAAMSSPDGARQFDDTFNVASRALVACPLPTVARLQGHAIGGGLLLATACDVRIVSNRATLGYPVSRIGLMLAAEPMSYLTRLIGPSRAKWLLYTGERLSAIEAESWGLVDRVIPADDFAERADHYIATIAAGAPLSNQASKYLIDTIDRDGRPDPTRVNQWYETIYTSHDIGEGFAAARDKRTPHFRGE